MATDSGTGTAGTSSRTKANKRRYCCVKDCHSREGQPGIRLYRFPGQPWEKERRRKWIVAVRRVKWNRRASAARSAKPEVPRTDINFGDREDTALNKTSSISCAMSSACVNALDVLYAAAVLAQEQTADQAYQTDYTDTCRRLVGFLCCMGGHDESTQV
ncbi:uncharacterized protein LOC142765313 [Rhipicephalus microplus]|uniref:uncharacterized protein LOC142765313 n=1 Tax=Rhipicephalus microplus TaxID=6941 RepID=UPI003F6C09AA